MFDSRPIVKQQWRVIEKFSQLDLQKIIYNVILCLFISSIFQF